MECSLRRGVARHVRKWTQALATRDLDHPPPAGPSHVRDEFLNQANAGDDIQLVVPAPFFGSTFEPGVLRIHACIVDEDVDGTKRGSSLRCESPDVGWNGEISSDEHRASSGAGELVDQLSSALPIAAVNDHGHIF